MRYSTILFDLDGTICDSYLGISNALKTAFQKHGINITDEEGIRQFVGPPLHKALKEYTDVEETIIPEVVKSYRDYLQNKGLFENILYDGVQDMLLELKSKGATLCIASTKVEPFIKKVLDYFNITDIFNFVGGSLMDGSRSDKNLVIQHVIDNICLKNLSTAVMIGDRKYDMKGAQIVGIDRIGALYGYGDREELSPYDPIYMAETISELRNFLVN